MMRYRLYCLSQENRIIDTAEVDCDTDEQAIATAQDFAGRGKVEIWQRRRRLGVFEAAGLPMLAMAD